MQDRLYLDTENGRVAGVCAGIAKWAKIDPAIVRLIFILGILGTSGAWLLAYIILSVILDDEPTT